MVGDGLDEKEDEEIDGGSEPLASFELMDGLTPAALRNCAFGDTGELL